MAVKTKTSKVPIVVNSVPIKTIKIAINEI